VGVALALVFKEPGVAKRRAARDGCGACRSVWRTLHPCSAPWRPKDEGVGVQRNVVAEDLERRDQGRRGVVGRELAECRLDEVLAVDTQCGGQLTKEARAGLLRA